MPNETPDGQLRKYLIGDLQVALRHLDRISQGILQPTPAVMREITNSVLDCVERIQRDMPEGSEGEE